jgi:hypothetical protein
MNFLLFIFSGLILNIFLLFSSLFTLSSYLIQVIINTKKCQVVYQIKQIYKKVCDWN